MGSRCLWSEVCHGQSKLPPVSVVGTYWGRALCVCTCRFVAVRNFYDAMPDHCRYARSFSSSHHRGPPQHTVPIRHPPPGPPQCRSLNPDDIHHRDLRPGIFLWKMNRDVTGCYVRISIAGGNRKYNSSYALGDRTECKRWPRSPRPTLSYSSERVALMSWGLVTRSNNALVANNIWRRDPNNGVRG